MKVSEEVKDKLGEIRDQVRPLMVSINRYNQNKAYVPGSPDVVSDGDTYGKEAEGSSDDILARQSNLVRNFYSPNKPYTGPY